MQIYNKQKKGSEKWIFLFPGVVVYFFFLVGLFFSWELWQEDEKNKKDYDDEVQ